VKQLRQREAEERRAARQQTVDVNQIPLGVKVLHFVAVDGISITSSRNGVGHQSEPAGRQGAAFLIVVDSLVMEHDRLLFGASRSRPSALLLAQQSSSCISLWGPGRTSAFMLYEGCPATAVIIWSDSTQNLRSLTSTYLAHVVQPEAEAKPARPLLEPVPDTEWWHAHTQLI